MNHIENVEFRPECIGEAKSIERRMSSSDGDVGCEEDSLEWNCLRRSGPDLRTNGQGFTAVRKLDAVMLTAQTTSGYNGSTSYGVSRALIAGSSPASVSRGTRPKDRWLEQEDDFDAAASHHPQLVLFRGRGASLRLGRSNRGPNYPLVC